MDFCRIFDDGRLIQGTLPEQPIIILFSLYEKPYFLFLNVLKRWPFQKNYTGIWSFLYHQGRWYFFSLKIWYYFLGGKWTMIFLKKKQKKSHRNMIYSSNFLKRWSFQKNCIGIWPFLYHKERWHFFFPKILYFFLQKENERWSFSKNTWKYDVSVCW